MYVFVRTPHDTISIPVLSIREGRYNSSRTRYIVPSRHSAGSQVTSWYHSSLNPTGDSQTQARGAGWLTRELRDLK